MLLAGDVGGTSTRLGLFARAPGRPTLVEMRAFDTMAFETLSDMVARFLDGREPSVPIEAACFGAAGPVRGQVVQMTNVPLLIDAREVRERTGIERTWLLNDLEAMAHAVPTLREEELAVLQAGVPSPTGNAALLAAGTGLGQAFLHSVEGRFVPAPSEGGHADFGARTPREIELLQELTRLFGRATTEHVVSGPGLVNIFRFVHRGPCSAIPADTPEALLPALISQAALERRCAQCVETLELFVGAYGAATGNLALYTVSTAGIYVGGGIAPKILPALRTGTFMDAFRQKPPMTELLEAIPVKVILNADTGLMGAAVYASQL